MWLSLIKVDPQPSLLTWSNRVEWLISQGRGVRFLLQLETQVLLVGISFLGSSIPAYSFIWSTTKPLRAGPPSVLCAPAEEEEGEREEGFKELAPAACSQLSLCPRMTELLMEKWEQALG